MNVNFLFLYYLHYLFCNNPNQNQLVYQYLMVVFMTVFLGLISLHNILDYYSFYKKIG